MSVSEDETNDVDVVEVYDADIDLITLVEANPKLWNKTEKGYKNTHERAMAFEAIGACLHTPMSGEQAMQRWTSLRAMYARQRRNCSTTPSGAGTAENVNLSPVFKAIHRFLAGVYLPRKTVNSSFKKIGKISSTPPTTETDLEYVQLVKNNCSNSTLLSKVLHVDVTGTETLSNFSPIPCSSSSAPNSSSEKYNVRPPKRCKSQATEETLKQSAENIDNLINKITNTLTEETQEEKAMCTVILHAVRHLQDSTFY